jgi:hypothetical protein
MKAPLLLALLLFTAPAHAQQVGIVVTGEANVQPQLAAQLERWLRDHGRQVVPGPLEPDAINTLIDCFVLEDMTCARLVIDRRSKARAVVFTRAEVTANGDGTNDVAITGYWFQKDREVLAERRVCAKCNGDKLHDTVDQVMLALVSEPPLPIAGAAPAPAEPMLVTTVEGPSSPKRTLPLGLMGAGGVALLAGAILIAIDQDPDPTGPQQETYRDSATGGVVIGLVGAAALGTGIYLWMRDRPDSAPVAAISRDGGFVGWAGRF